MLNSDIKPFSVAEQVLDSEKSRISKDTMKVMSILPHDTFHLQPLDLRIPQTDIQYDP